MAQQVTARQMDPNARRIIDRRSWNQVHFVLSPQAIQMLGAVAEDNAVDSGCEAYGSVGW